MIEPPSFRSRNAFCTVNSAPFTLMLKNLSKCSSVTAPEGNKFANAGVGERNIDSSLRLRDGLVKTIEVGQCGNVPANPKNADADCHHGLVEFLLATARDEDMAPSLAKSFAVSNPIPSVPPVMTAVLPSSFLAINFFRCC